MSGGHPGALLAREPVATRSSPRCEVDKFISLLDSYDKYGLIPTSEDQGACARAGHRVPALERARR